MAAKPTPRRRATDTATAAEVHVAAAEAKAELRLALLHLERAMDKAAEVLHEEGGTDGAGAVEDKG